MATAYVLVVKRELRYQDKSQKSSGARCGGGGAQEQVPRAGPKAAGRLGKHQPTQPVAEGVWVGIRRLSSIREKEGIGKIYTAH